MLSPASLPRPRLARTAVAAALLAGAGLISAGAGSADAAYHKPMKKTVVINGTRASEKITLRVTRAQPDRLQVDFGDDGTAERKLKLKHVRKIKLDARGGNDTLRIDRAGVPFSNSILTVLAGGRGNDTLTGGAGPERLRGGKGSDRIIWNPGDGSDIVDGGRGQDTLAFNGSAAAEKVELSAKRSRLRLTRDVGAIAMNVGTVEQVDLTTLGGADALTAHDLSSTAVKRIDADLGSDGRHDSVTLEGRARHDDAAINADGANVAVSGLASAVRIRNQDATDALVLDGAGGDDAITAGNGLAALMKLTLDGGAGADTIHGGDGADVILGNDGNDTVNPGRGDDLALLGAGDDRAIWNPGDGSDTLEGQSGTDTMEFNGSNANEKVDVSANGSRVRFFRDVGNITMDIDGVEAIDHSALGGADKLHVADLSGTALRQIRTDEASTPGGSAGDGQVDAVEVDGTPGADAVKISRDVSSPDPTVSGLPATVSVVHTEADLDTLDVQGGAGNDNLAVDEANGPLAPVFLDGQDGEDTLTGGSGDDVISGGPSSDALLGRGGVDVLVGNDGNDTLTGGDGEDLALAGAGDDAFIWNPGDDSDTLEGDAGTDRATVDGGNGAETFTVAANGTRVRVDRTTLAPFVQDLGSVEKVDIEAGGGDDTISAGNGLAALTQLTLDGGSGADTIGGGDGADVLLGGDGDDSVDGNRGDDVAFLGAGDDEAIWDPGDGSDTLEGQAGKDTMQFNGSNANENVDVSANGSRVRFFRDVANITMDVNGIERTQFAALGGADKVTVGDLSGTDADLVGVDLGGTLGGTTGDGQPDQVIENGTPGDDHVAVSGSFGDVLALGLPADLAIANAESTDQLTVNGLAGDDTIDSSGLAGGTIGFAANP